MCSETTQVDPRQYRNVIGRFATGVAVVTTVAHGEPAGMTVNSLTSVSLDPTLLLVCLTRDSRTAQAVEASGKFAVNLLDHTQMGLSNSFARAGEERFTDVALRPRDDAVPVLEGGLGYLVCDVRQVFPGGDHIIVLGDVAECSEGGGDPLVFWQGRYARKISYEDYPVPNWWG